MSKAIALFSDGTGNSAAALHKTNVWRLYQALDVAPSASAPRQIAYYDDGVGTSSFKLFAMLGGIFGLGLQRNVLDIYTFLCRNYEPGDRIYAFGFSRGAFTIRVLVALVAGQGLVQCPNEAAFRKHAADAYREYRRRYKQTGRLVALLRKVRDLFIRTWRTWRRQTLYEDVPRLQVSEIQFVGVWDTVAAYGLPIAELTRGIDDWVWPLSMPNYVLGEKVLSARHALSLDDERDTFHPLLWDEVAEAKLVEDKEVAAGRLQQIWFAGVHSNLGGGYPDDGLAHVSLEWMLDEAVKAGLRFKHQAIVDIRRTADVFGPIYDSRKGFGAYYRYQPRKIAARVHPPDPTTKIMQDPDLKGAGLLTEVKVHASVLERIREGTDGYAPIVLPASYTVVGSSGTSSPSGEVDAQARAQEQERVWNDVWKRRLTYFTTVIVSFLLVAMPLIEAISPPSACIGPQCIISPVLLTLGAFVPSFVAPWLEAFAHRPGWFLVGVAAVFLLLRTSTGLQQSIQDQMRDLWAQSLNLSGRKQGPARRSGWADNLIYSLRSSPAYQAALQKLKWRIAPAVFGLSALALIISGGLIVTLAAVLSIIYRTELAAAERSNRFCASPEPQALFSPRAMCWSTRHQVEEGARYRVAFRVTRPWFDEAIAASPTGFASERMPWHLRYPGFLIRRATGADWLQPLAKIIPPSGHGGPIEPLEVVCDPLHTLCSAEFVAKASGTLHLFVNDAILSWNGLTDEFYLNNEGEAEVTVSVLKPPR